MKEVLGYSNIGVTASWYTHLDERSRIEASRKLSNKMTEILESKV